MRKPKVSRRKWAVSTEQAWFEFCHKQYIWIGKSQLGEAYTFVDPPDLRKVGELFIRAADYLDHQASVKKKRGS